MAKTRGFHGWAILSSLNTSMNTYIMVGGSIHSRIPTNLCSSNMLSFVTTVGGGVSDDCGHTKKVSARTRHHFCVLSSAIYLQCMGRGQEAHSTSLGGPFLGSTGRISLATIGYVSDWSFWRPFWPTRFESELISSSWEVLCPGRSTCCRSRMGLTGVASGQIYRFVLPLETPPCSWENRRTKNWAISWRDEWFAPIIWWSQAALCLSLFPRLDKSRHRFYVKCFMLEL